MRGSACAIVWISDELFMHIVGVVVCTRSERFAHALGAFLSIPALILAFLWLSFIYLFVVGHTSSGTRQIGFKVENKIKYLHVFDTLSHRHSEASVRSRPHMHIAHANASNKWWQSECVWQTGSGIIELIVFPLCGVCAPRYMHIVHTKRTCNTLDWSSCFCRCRRRKQENRTLCRIRWHW